MIAAIAASYAAVFLLTSRLQYLDYQLGMPDLLSATLLLCTFGVTGSIALWFVSKKSDTQEEQHSAPSRHVSLPLTILGAVTSVAGVASLVAAFTLAPQPSPEQSDFLLIAIASSGLLLPFTFANYFFFSARSTSSTRIFSFALYGVSLATIAALASKSSIEPLTNAVTPYAPPMDMVLLAIALPGTLFGIAAFVLFLSQQRKQPLK
ncbi:MAG: hypothetical protein Q3999_05870 [Buchananella hordeovulneris]|nr:hypothetical protein [Buchananella hordeovulneris]